MEDYSKKNPRPTVAQAERLDFVMAEIERLANDGSDEKAYFKLVAERFQLINCYDWLDEPFEENGKQGLKNVKGEVVVPAIYDKFCMPQLYYQPYLEVGAIKDGKAALVKRDGKGTPVTDFEYHYIERIPRTAIYGVWKSEDLKHFALMVVGMVFTPFEITDYGILCDGGLPIFGDNGKMGVVDTINLRYIAPEYDEVIDNGMYEDFTFIKDGVKGRVTLDKRFISDDDYDNLSEDEMDKIDEIGFIGAVEN